VLPASCRQSLRCATFSPAMAGSVFPGFPDYPEPQRGSRTQPGVAEGCGALPSVKPPKYTSLSGEAGRAQRVSRHRAAQVVLYRIFGLTEAQRSQRNAKESLNFCLHRRWLQFLCGSLRSLRLRVMLRAGSENSRPQAVLHVRFWV